MDHEVHIWSLEHIVLTYRRNNDFSIRDIFWTFYGNIGYIINARARNDTGELFPHSSTSRRISWQLAVPSSFHRPVSIAPTAAFAAAATFELYLWHTYTWQNVRGKWLRSSHSWNFVEGILTISLSNYEKNFLNIHSYDENPTARDHSSSYRLNSERVESTERLASITNPGQHVDPRRSCTNAG